MDSAGTNDNLADDVVSQANSNPGSESSSTGDSNGENSVEGSNGEFDGYDLNEEFPVWHFVETSDEDSDDDDVDDEDSDQAANHLEEPEQFLLFSLRQFIERNQISQFEGRFN